MISHGLLDVFNTRRLSALHCVRAFTLDNFIQEVPEHQFAIFCQVDLRVELKTIQFELFISYTCRRKQSQILL
jgi:hypothetical protein